MRRLVVGAMLGLAIVSGTSPGVAAEITGGLINGAWETGSGGAGPPPGFQTLDQNAPPVFSVPDGGAPILRSFNEGEHGTVGVPVTAADPENDELFYSIAGADAEFFSVDASSGQLETNTNVDFDFETRNAYELTLSVHDHKDAAGEPSTEIDDSIAVAISVTNVDEPGRLELWPASAPRVGAVVTAVLTDPDGVSLLPGTHHARWDRSRSPNGSSWSEITYFGPARIGGDLGYLPAGSMYTPVENDVGMYLRVNMTYRDGHGAGKRAEIVISSVVQAREPAPALTVQDLITGLTLPRDIGSTPDGAMLFTERSGKLSVRLTDGTVRPVSADFSDLQAARRGVLMSLAIDPDFATNRRFYTYQGDLPLNMQVVVWEMNADYTAATRVVDPLLEGFFGGARLRFGPDGYLWMSVHNGANHAAPQDLGLLGGKVLRFDAATGQGTADNPFPTAPLVYTYGHRNPQGLALRPGTTEMWSVEHGPLWDDEVNLLTPGTNYGWNPNPEGPSERAQNASMTDLDAFPDAVVARWTSGFATIAPSGATFLEGDDWGEWEGRLAVATLKTLSLRLFEFSAKGEYVSQVVATDVERLHYRLRTPVLGPDGALYITTSDATNDPGTDRILRVVPSLPPAFAASTADHTVAEHSDPSTVIATFAATDPEGGEIRYTLSGTDAGSFNLEDERLGELRANQAFDFETRSTYEVVADAHDAYGLTDSLTLTVSVTNIDETGRVTFDRRRPILDQPLTATLEDADEVQGVESWTWERSTSRSGPWTAVAGSSDGLATSVYRPNADDVGYLLRVSASYTDGHGSNKSVIQRSANSVIAAPVNNNPPSFATLSTTREVAEDARPNATVGAAVTATDTDPGDVLTYTLTGSSPFTIDSSNGRIRVAASAMLDHETGPSHIVSVTASDSSNATASITVTINVTNVNEPPEADDIIATTDEDTAVVLNVLADSSDPENDVLTVSLGGGPRKGSATVDPDTYKITYTPKTDYHGSDTLTYILTDTGRLTDTGAIALTVRAVNDPPLFSAGPRMRSVAHSAQGGVDVGNPVTATDVDGDMLTYRLLGRDASSFEINEDTGQITVGSGVVFYPALQFAYTVTVEARDRDFAAEVEVMITVVERVQPRTTGGGGGGGGGGPPPVPIPSDADFDWNVTRDIESLHSDNELPTGIWSDGHTLWVLQNAASGADSVFAYKLENGERLKDREFELDRRNRFSHGIWLDGETVWVADSGQDQVFAYVLESGERNEEREFELAERNRDPRGIWSDGEIIYVLDSVKDALFAYKLATAELLAEYPLDKLNRSPRGIWSDGVTIWVSDDGAKRLFGYEFEDGALVRNEDLEFTFRSLLKAGNGSPRGIWSDGDIMYVVDEQDDKVYTYNIPDAIIAQLASLSLSDIEIGEFSTNHFDYTVSAAHDLSATTVMAEARHKAARVVI